MNFTLLAFISILSLGACKLTGKAVDRTDGGTLAQDSIADDDDDGLSNDEEARLGTDPKNGDTDGDGLNDGAEVNLHKSNPKDADSDKGGVSDSLEVNRGTDPNQAADDLTGDADADGLSDAAERSLGTNLNVADTDRDGLTDGAEANTFDTNPLAADSDRGGRNDGLEVALGLDPRAKPSDDANPLPVDGDGDGLSDAVEASLGTNPAEADSDKDGLSDGAEVNALRTSPKDLDSDRGGVHDGAEVSLGTNPREAPDTLEFIDTDSDGLTNAEELTLGTNASLADTDLDTLSDGAEVRVHRTNPLRLDTDGGGAADGLELNRNLNPLNPADDTQLSACERAPGVNTLQTRFSFAANAAACPYGIAPSLIARNGFYQAVRTVTLPLNIANNDRLCSISVKINQASFMADDEFVVHLGEIALAANSTSTLTPANGEQTFNFSTLAGRAHVTTKVPYCYGTPCALPNDGATGAITYTSDPALLNRVRARAATLPSLSISLSVLGDDDAADCTWSGLSGVVDYTTAR